MPSPSPTETSLRALASALGTTESNKLEERWASMKKLPHVRALYSTHPKAVEAIVEFARMRADGRLQGTDGYAEMTEKVIASVATGKAAA